MHCPQSLGQRRHLRNYKVRHVCVITWLQFRIGKTYGPIHNYLPRLAIVQVLAICTELISPTETCSQHPQELTAPLNRNPCTCNIWTLTAWDISWPHIFHVCGLSRHSWTLQLLILINQVDGLWCKQGYGVECHSEAIHQALVGVPCGRYLRVMATHMSYHNPYTSEFISWSIRTSYWPNSDLSRINF